MGRSCGGTADAQQAPEDFAEFWSDTLAESRRFDTPTTVLRHDSPLRTVDVYDVRFPGYLGQQIDRVAARSSRKQRAPRNNRRARRVRQRARPGRGRDLRASCGFAHLHIDSRGRARLGARATRLTTAL